MSRWRKRGTRGASPRQAGASFGSRMAQLSGSLVHTIGAMPFVGRHMFRSSVYRCKDARTRIGRVAAYAGHLAITSGMQISHVPQLTVGAEMLKANGQNFLENPSLASGTASTVAGLYTLANVATMYTQIDIAARLGVDQARRWHETPQTAEPPKPRPPISARQVAKDFAITAGAGGVVAATYVFGPFR